MAKAIKKVKEAAAKLAKLRKKPGMSNAGKYPNVPKDEFAGPNGTYPIDTLKRAKSAIKLAHFSPHQLSIIRKVYKEYPQLKKDEDKDKNKKSPVAYNSSPFPLKQERDKRKKGQKYKTGADIDETDWEVHNKELNVQDISRIQEDKKGQYITSVYNDTIRPIKGRHFKMTWGDKERNFTPNPNRK